MYFIITIKSNKKSGDNFYCWTTNCVDTYVYLQNSGHLPPLNFPNIIKYQQVHLDIFINSSYYKIHNLRQFSPILSPKGKSFYFYQHSYTYISKASFCMLNTRLSSPHDYLLAQINREEDFVNIFFSSSRTC